MGEVEVLVGCPHKLRRPITSTTRYPCPVCAEMGFPGLWAIALTVDYPRLARDAVKGVKAPRVEKVEMPPEVARALRAFREKLANIKPPDLSPLTRMVDQIMERHRAGMAKVAEQVAIETKPMRMTQRLDPERNQMIVNVTQDYRFVSDERLAAVVREQMRRAQAPRIPGI